MHPTYEMSPFLAILLGVCFVVLTALSVWFWWDQRHR
jgi:hypothetical protein